MAPKSRERAERNRERTQKLLHERRVVDITDERKKNTKKVRKYTASIRKKDVRVQEDGYLNLGDMSHVCSHCGALHWLCERSITCGSSLKSPRFHRCCANGQITPHTLRSSVCLQCSTHFRDQDGNIRAPEPHEICSTCHSIVPQPLPALEDPPLLLRVLLTSENVRAKRFRKDIRQYNNALAMGSVRANFVSRGPGPSAYNPTLTIQGRMYHQIGAMSSLPGQAPQFASLYFHDTDYATMNRKDVHRTLDEELLRELAQMLEERNNLVKSFVALRDLIASKRIPEELELVLHAHERIRPGHERKYNMPESSEVAALIVGEQHGPLDIVLRRKAQLTSNGEEKLDVISVGNRLRDPLCYPLIFFDGSGGWHSKLYYEVTSSGKMEKITPKLFYSRLIFEREGEFNIILRCGRLFQQFLCEAAYTMEAERLSFLRFNQSKLRATNHTRLLELLGDAAMARNEVSAWTEGITSRATGQIGRLVVLPATYIGGDRYMRMKMHDIISISNSLGHPDVFLTMTCNPYWPEITDAIFEGQKSQDRPDICNRVFKMKQKILLEYLKSENPFGRMIAHVSVIEFQKRGLPHAHIILFLDRKAKHDMQNSDYVDKLISAEILPNSDPSLRNLVLKHMIHKPCLQLASAPCLRDGKCCRGFPKHFRDETGISEGANYISYRRRSLRDGGEVVRHPYLVHGSKYQDCTIDNSWVIPYSPQLLASSIVTSTLSSVYRRWDPSNISSSMFAKGKTGSRLKFEMHAMFNLQKCHTKMLAKRL